MSHFTKDYTQFFIDLAPNNNKDWFDANRKRYEESVKKPFATFVQQFIDFMASKDPKYKNLTASECIFRINRDIRFSKDKTPYKTFCSAVIAPNGRKSDSVHGIYFELSPEAVRVYGGVYEIDKDRLELVREGIAQDIRKFRSVIEKKDFVKLFGELRGDKNKVLPAHLKESAALEPYIYNKQFYVMTEFPASLITSDKLLSTLIECYTVAQPFEQYFNQFIHRN